MTAFITAASGNRKRPKWRATSSQNFYLDDDGKSCEELDADFLSFEKLEQYDENGIVGFSMSGGQHTVVVYEFDSEVDASYLPFRTRESGEGNEPDFRRLRGRRRGGAEERGTLRSRSAFCRTKYAQMEKGVPALFSTPMPAAEKFSALPFSEEDFSEWLAAKLDYLYPRRAVRSVRRLTHRPSRKIVRVSWRRRKSIPISTKCNMSQPFARFSGIRCAAIFTSAACAAKLIKIFTSKIRQTEDTAEVAKLKKEAYDEFKEQKKLTLKEFTALNTAAKSQEARLANKISAPARKTLDEIQNGFGKSPSLSQVFPLQRRCDSSLDPTGKTTAMGRDSRPRNGSPNAIAK